MAVTTTDFNDLADGSAWPAPWVRVGGTSLTIQSNRGRLTKGASSYASVQAHHGGVTHDNGEVYLAFVVPAVANDQIFQVYYRLGADFSDTYAMDVYMSGFNRLKQVVAGTTTIITGSDQTVAAYTVGATYALRLRYQGTAHKWRVWNTSGAEPAAWNREVTHTGFTSGRLGLVWNDATTTASSIDVDDVAIDDLVDTTPPAAPTGLTALKSVA